MKLDERGMTLIELVLVIALIGVLAGFALPSVIEWREMVSRRQVASDVARILMQSRSRAISRNETVTVTFNIDGSATNLNNSYQVVAGTPAAVVETGGLADGIEIRGNATCSLTSGPMSIRFNPDGTSFTNTGNYICVYSGNQVRFSAGVVSSSTGRVATKRGMP